MVSLAGRVNTYLVVGSAEYPKFGKGGGKIRRSGNTALFFNPEGKIINQYLKMRLVPFGEYVPLEGRVPWPGFMAPRGMKSHVEGMKPVLFQIDGTPFCTLICWEILFPEMGRTMVKNGAQFIVNLSNEAWFGRSAAPYQILAMSAFRAVENRVNLVRCTNTGVSCFIDPYGRITSRVSREGKDLFVEGTLTKKIILAPAGTFYTQYGDLFAFACIVFSVTLMVWTAFKRRPGRGPDQGDRVGEGL
jgi:apolipoprotein N-acyltransferase